MSAQRDRYCLHLHGEPALLLPGGLRVALEPRAAALLALAALEPGITRLRAATMLWPDSADPRRNLRQQLLRFRRMFERDLLVGQDALKLADSLRLAPATQPLLGTLSYDDCEDFALWLDQQRRRERTQRVCTVRAHLLAAEAAGDLDAALHAAHELLAIDDRDEAHHLECMRLHYLAGNAAAGLAAFERLRQMLDAEFGTPPTAASLQLADALRTAHHGTATATALVGRFTTLPVTLKRPPLMAGRAQELAAVQQSLADGRVVWLEGEAGLGKSRLIAEWISTRSAAEGPVLAGAGRPGDAGAPYATLARLLRPWLAEPPPRLGAEARMALRHIAPRVDETTQPDAPALRPGALASAVADLLTAQAIACVVIDDLHFTDDASIELFAGLAAQADSTTGWLFAARPAEVPAAGYRLRAALIELQRLSSVALSPLRALDVAVMVDALGVAGLQGAALAEPLLRHTGGNPLFVLETMKQGLHDGSLARGELPRPSNVATLIETRLGRLSERALTLARVAAIAGVDFHIELAESAIGARAVQLASAWQELQDAQILRDEAFAHDLVSDAVQRGVPAVVARRVHAQCAAWLADHGGEPSRVARHWRNAGHPAPAASAFEQAARRAGSASRATDEAALWGEAARAHAEAGQHDQRFEAMASRVTALVSSQLNEEAFAEAQALLQHATNDLQRVRAYRVWFALMGQRGQGQRVIDESAAAMALARRVGAQEELVRMACDVAGNLSRAGRLDDAYSLLQPLRDWVDQHAQADVRCLWYGYWAFVLHDMGRLRESIDGYQRALSAGESVGRRDELGAVMVNLGSTYRDIGQLRQALDCSRRAAALMDDDPNDTARRALVLLALARDLADTGHFGESLGIFETVMPQIESTGSAFWICAARSALSRLWLHLGQLARATQAFQADDSSTPYWMRAARVFQRMELARFAGQQFPSGELQLARNELNHDPLRALAADVRALRNAPADLVLAQADNLAHAARKQERFGTLLALRVHETRSAMALDQPARAVQAAREAIDWVEAGYAPDSMYLPEVHLVAWQALSKAGEPATAQAALSAGSLWIQTHALPQVPAPFLDSFLHRNPVNRDLLAAASR